jgi:hypothetical protein
MPPSGRLGGYTTMPPCPPYTICNVMQIIDPMQQTPDTGVRARQQSKMKGKLARCDAGRYLEGT